MSATLPLLDVNGNVNNGDGDEDDENVVDDHDVGIQFEEETVVLEGESIRSWSSSGSRTSSSLIRQFNDTVTAIMNRLNLRTFFLICLFVIAVATVSSVKRVDDEFKVPELRPRSVQSNYVSRRNSVVDSPAPQFENYRYIIISPRLVFLCGRVIMLQENRSSNGGISFEL